MESQLAVLNKQSDQMSPAERERWWSKHGTEIQHWQSLTGLDAKSTQASYVRRQLATMGELNAAMKAVQAARDIDPRPSATASFSSVSSATS